MSNTVTPSLLASPWIFGIEHFSVGYRVPGSTNLADRITLWREVPVASSCAYDASDVCAILRITNAFVHADLYQLAASCLFLEAQGIVPNMQSIALLERSCALNLFNAPCQKPQGSGFHFEGAFDKHVLIYCLETFAYMPCKLLHIPHPNKGNIFEDVSAIDAYIAVELFTLQSANAHCSYYVYPVCTQEGYQIAGRSITLNSLNSFVQQQDFDRVEDTHLRERIVKTLRQLDREQLPSAQTVEDHVLSPYYLYRTVVSSSVNHQKEGVES